MFFWGLLVGAALTASVFLINTRGLKLTWYEWLIGAIGIILAFVAIQHYFGSTREFVEKSAYLGLALFGIPAIILLAIAWQLAYRHNKIKA